MWHDRGVIALLFLLLPLRAEFLKIEIGFGGMECASCTDFLESRFARNRGVKSVHVDKAKGILTLELKPENKLRLDQVRDQVQQGGFTPKRIHVVVQGEAQADGALRIPEIDQVLAAGDSKPLAAHAGKRVRAEGEVKMEAGRTAVFEAAKASPVE